MVLPGDPAIEQLGAGDCLYHYNILRPIHFVSSGYRHAVIPRLRARLGRSPAALDWERLWSAWSYDSDPEWTRLATASSLPKRALVLAAPRSVLIARAAERAAVEPSRPGDAPYERERWLQILATVDLVGLYRGWCVELSARGIAWRLIDSSGDKYPEIPQERLSDLLGRRPDVIGAA